MSTSVIERLRQPEYTGANRCVPCTATNVVIAAVLSAAVAYGLAALVGPVGWLAGIGLFAASLAAIWLRGYLVPGTPELTKRYFPDWLLARFDKAPPPGVEARGDWDGAGSASTAGAVPAGDGAATDPAGDGSTAGSATAGATADTAGDAGERVDAAEAGGTTETEAGERADAAEEEPRFVDPEEALLSAAVVEPCEAADDLCLTDEFEDDWLAAVRNLRDLRDRSDPQRVVDVLGASLGLDDLSVDRDQHDRPVATAGGQQVQAWVSEGALVGDLAALGVLAERVDGWETVPVPQRMGIARALRSFYSTCPVCEGFVAATEDTVESCCRSWDVVAIRCTDCEEHLLELDPTQLADAASDEGVSPTEGGFTR